MASSATLLSPSASVSTPAIAAASSSIAPSHLTSTAAITASSGGASSFEHLAPAQPKFAPLRPFRDYLDSIAVENESFAWMLYNSIPGQCPFERTITLFGRTIVHIPPLCKLNPFYEQVVGLRFRAMCYLVDECGIAL